MDESGAAQAQSVEVEKVEDLIDHALGSAAALQRLFKRVKIGMPVRGLHDHFAVDDECVIVERHCRGEPRHAARPVVSPPRKEFHAAADMTLETIAVVFDLMHPIAAARRALR